MLHSQDEGEKKDLPVLFGLKDLERQQQRQSELHWTRPQQEERERKAGTPRPNPMPTGTLTSGRGVRSADAPLRRPVRARILVTVERGPLFSAEEDAGSRMEVRETDRRMPVGRSSSCTACCCCSGSRGLFATAVRCEIRHVVAHCSSSGLRALHWFPCDFPVWWVAGEMTGVLPLVFISQYL